MTLSQLETVPSPRMSASQMGRVVSRCWLGLLLWLGLMGAGLLSAQTAATGTIEGRVFDAGRGEYLENALVSVEGSTVETLTDATGGYRITALPAGQVRLKVFYTGLNPLSVTATVTAGQTLQRDLTFGAQGREGGALGRDVVQLG